MEWVVNATPRLLYSWERPGAHFIGGLVSPRAALDAYRKSRLRGVRFPNRPAPSESLNDCTILPEFCNETVEILPQREMSEIFQNLHAYFPAHCTTRNNSSRFDPCVTPCQRPCMVLYSDCGCFKWYLFQCTTA